MAISHPQAIVVLDGRLVTVDIDLATILLKLNFKGLYTSYSCQGGKNNLGMDGGYICFQIELTKKNRKTVEKFLGLKNVPIYKCNKNGNLKTKEKPPYPYWETSTHRDYGNWVIRFQKV